MIPQISRAPGVVQLVLNFLQELEQQGFTGDTATSYADRLTMSTDNSIYQLPRCGGISAFNRRCGADRPSCRAGTLFIADLYPAAALALMVRRSAIIVDMSRHMNRIIEINPEEGWVRVEAGVIKDQLNQYLKPFGYFCARTFDQ